MMKRTPLLALAASALLLPSFGETRLAMEPGEHWWGAANFFGREMPFTERTHLTIDLRHDNYHNQCASFLVSDRGRAVWTEQQSKIVISNGVIAVEAASPVETLRLGKDLPSAYRAACAKWFPPSGKHPDPLFVSAPQLNTWIELTYHQNQRDILAYAQSMLDHGIPPGVLMIDDTWQAGYGDWRFEPSRFPDPKAMVTRLHEMGYRVMLWMCPYVGADLPAFRRVAWGVNPDDVRGYPQKGGFLTDAKTGRVTTFKWWNGLSAFLDFSHPNARAWFAETLDGLVRDYGVDGFKLDGADLFAYDRRRCGAFDPKATCGSLNNGYCAFALRYPFCEIRNTWRMQQMPAVVRLADKRHDWQALGRMVADMIAAGFVGQPFICPDMVGGGEWTTFIPGSPFDPELFIRSAQVHALAPMMQISASPWRVLPKDLQDVFSRVVALRQKFASKFVELTIQAGRDGEPIIRNLEYNHPGKGYGTIRDEFMMGRDLLVAPVLTKGAASRRVTLPPGRWRGDDGTLRIGPCAFETPTPLARLPHFVRER